MAIIWEVQITNVNVQSKRADIVFTRTDDVTQKTETYSYNNTVIGTTGEKAALLDAVWNQHLESISKQDNIDAFITNLEQSAKTNLETREV